MNARIYSLALVACAVVLSAQSRAQQTCPFDDGNSSLAVEGVILTRYALAITGAPLAVAFLANDNQLTGTIPSVTRGHRSVYVRRPQQPTL